MVFPSDPEWRRILKGVADRSYAGNAQYNVRYRSWGTEHLLIRCVKRFMPWLHDIIILLAQESQVQPWMQQEGVRVVFHHDFMPPQHLPTYNSRAMEMYLHRIPGLSERFLYGNDDMFPLSLLQETDFFIGPLPCQHHTLKNFPPSPNAFHLACRGGLNFVASEFGQHFTNQWLKGGHSIAPILLETCRHLWQRDPQTIEQSVSPFRETKNFNQYIYSWYQHFTGRYIDRVPPRKYLSTKSGIDSIRNFLSQPVEGIVCINDNEYASDIQHYAEVVRECLERRLEG